MPTSDPRLRQPIQVILAPESHPKPYAAPDSPCIHLDHEGARLQMPDLITTLPTIEIVRDLKQIPSD